MNKFGAVPPPPQAFYFLEQSLCAYELCQSNLNFLFYCSRSLLIKRIGVSLISGSICLIHSIYDEIMLIAHVFLQAEEEDQEAMEEAPSVLEQPPADVTMHAAEEKITNISRKSKSKSIIIHLFSLRSMPQENLQEIFQF